MKNLKDLRIFIETCRQGSLSACARKMDLSPAVVSASVKRLEAELGVLLFVRSTRSLRLTHQGEHFLQACREAVEILDQASQTLQDEKQELNGVIQLSAPSDLGRNLVVPWLDEFMEQHPRVELRLQLSDSLADLYSQPIDMALRYGEPRDSALIAIPIDLQHRPVLVAAPSYLAAHGAPTSPQELLHHNCLCHAHRDTLHTRWPFTRGDQTLAIDVTGNRRCQDGDITRRWAVAGKGVAYKARLDVAEDILAGRLVELDVGWECEAFPLYLLCAERRLLNPTVRAFKDHLLERVERLLRAFQ